MMNKILMVVSFFMFFLNGIIYGQNTGKLSGKIIDAASNEPLIGVNIVLKGTYYGAASDVNGEFTIANITPG
ncbi:MAG: carboxypeptidase-like regulatory domain-containing protein, partial [Ignavibacteriaceae bacterium]